MISVIITTHNGRLEHLKRAIESVENQSYADWELIIVNDGAKDGTKEYLESIKSDKIIPIHRSKPFGCDTLPKNRGTKASKGEYIAYLDSDNTYTKDHLAVLLRTLEHNPTVDVAYGQRMVHVPNGKSQIGITTEFDTGILMTRNFIDTSDVLIRREAIFSVGGWDERYEKYVDWNLWVRMAKAGIKFKRAPYIITDYYIHDEQKSAKKLTSRDDVERGVFVPEWDWYDLEIDLPYLHKPKELKVAVYSLTKDRLDYTKACFTSLREKAGYAFDHFIIDNGSVDKTTMWLAEYGPKYLQVNESNEGISKASNDAVKEILKGDYDIIIKYDNDCLSLSDDWIKEIVEVYKRWGVMCLSPYPEGLRDNPGGPPRINHWRVAEHMIGLTNHIGGLCHIAPRKAYEHFKWDNESPLHGMQDLELSNWLTKNGYIQGYIEDLKIEHYEGTEAQHARYPKYFQLRKKEKVTVYEVD